MSSRSNRGFRRVSTRIRLAIAAAVLVGGGAVGAVAVAASHSGGAVAATSAGYSHKVLSPQQALSSAMNGWNQSPSNSLATLTKMTPMRNFEMMAYHKHTIAIQRGTVLAAERNAFVIKSANHQLELWYVNHGTKFLNVGPSNVGMRAMTGGTMAMPGNMNMNMRTKVLARGDFVFIFGDKVNGRLIAQLVLFVAPIRVNVTPTPTHTMPTQTVTATPTWTATPGVTASPTATAPMSLPTHS